MEPTSSNGTFYKIALVVEYEGTRYAGFQLQPQRPTVQGELESALGRMTQEAVRVQPASRTDAGTHAWGQVVAFQTRAPRPVEAFVRGTNAYLPPDIRVQRAYRVPVGFDPRRDAYAREYHYRILRRASPSALLRQYAHHIPSFLNVEAMRQAAQGLPGARDWASFTSPAGGASTIRRLDRVEVTTKGEMVTIEMEGNAFLPQQVRRTAGALVQVGLGRLRVEELQQLVESPQPGAARPTLPAHGLYLMRVRYHGFPPAEPIEQERR